GGVGVLPGVARGPHLGARGVGRDQQALAVLAVFLAGRRRRGQRAFHTPLVVDAAARIVGRVGAGGDRGERNQRGQSGGQPRHGRTGYSRFHAVGEAPPFAYMDWPLRDAATRVVGSAIVDPWLTSCRLSARRRCRPAPATASTARWPRWRPS